MNIEKQAIMEEDIDKKPVLVYYCQCGKSIERAGDPTRIALDKQSSKEYRKMQELGRRVETITLAEYKKIPFMCNGVEDCPEKKEEESKKPSNGFIPGGFTKMKKL